LPNISFCLFEVSIDVGNIYPSSFFHEMFIKLDVVIDISDSMLRKVELVKAKH